MTTTPETARQRFAEELRRSCGLRSATRVRAFAELRREGLLGPGPWSVLAPSKQDAVELQGGETVLHLGCCLARASTATARGDGR